MTRPLFSTGTARGGTNLVTKMLNVHVGVHLASDPFLPLFKQLRNDAVTHAANSEGAAGFDPAAPLDDYYYSRRKLAILDLVQEASLEMPYPRADHSTLMRALAPRTALSAGHLVPFLGELAADTYKGVIENAIRVVGRASGAMRPWLGFHENWAVEFFGPLARAFPQSRLLIVIRDPRAALASSMSVQDKQLVPHTLSYLRNWRKLVAFATFYRSKPELSDRLLMVRYEDAAREPERTARELTHFLDLPFDGRMIDAANFRDPSGRTWAPNSALRNESAGRIYGTSIDAWMQVLSPEVVEVVELVCGPEMRLLGYAPLGGGDQTMIPSEKAFTLLDHDQESALGWKVGQPEVTSDVGAELIRRGFLADAEEARAESWVRQYFLFIDAFHALRTLGKARVGMQ